MPNKESVRLDLQSKLKNSGNGNSSQYIPIAVCVSKENLAIPIFHRYNNVE